MTLLISADVNGAEGNGASYNQSISRDGRYVTFVSWASNLVPNDTNNLSDIFIRDLNTGSITRISTDVNGNQANSYSHVSSISADGRHVAFDSAASNLVRSMMFLDAFTLNKPEIFIGNCAAKFDEKKGELTDETTRGFIKQQLAAFATFIARVAPKS